MPRSHCRAGEAEGLLCLTLTPLLLCLFQSDGMEGGTRGQAQQEHTVFVMGMAQPHRDRCGGDSA